MSLSRKKCCIIFIFAITGLSIINIDLIVSSDINSSKRLSKNFYQHYAFTEHEIENILSDNTKQTTSVMEKYLRADIADINIVPGENGR